MLNDYFNKKQTCLKFMLRGIREKFGTVEE